MVDTIAPISPVVGPFDTAAMQIAQALAQADAANANELTYLQEVANANDASNTQALDSTTTPAPTDPYLTNGIFNLDASGNPTMDPSNLAFLNEFGSILPNSPTSDSIKAQQLHDMGILQRDVVLLEEAANANNHVPLTNSATTLDFSLVAQGIASGTAVASVNTPAPLTSAQLVQIGNILQPIANAPLTPALLQQIQDQFPAGQYPMQLSLNTMVLAMNLIASMQPSPYHVTENTVTKVDNQAVAAVSAIDRVAIEDSAIR